MTMEPLATVDPPSRPLARASREVLERLLLHLSELPAKVDRGPIQASIGAALTALARIDRSSIDDLDHLELVRSGVAAVGKARGLMSAAEALGRGPQVLSKTILDVEDALTKVVEPTIALVLGRQDHLLRRRQEPVPEKPKLVPFEACFGTPRLFFITRDPLALFGRAVRSKMPEDEDAADLLADETGETEELDIAEDSVDDAADETLENKAESAFGAEDGLVPAELKNIHSGIWGDTAAAGLARLTRDIVEEVGSLGMLRSPAGPDAAWGVGLVGFEERLLQDVDAFMALAEPLAEPLEPGFDAISELVTWAADAMVPDPVRAFARAFLLGCIAGEDTARTAIMALRMSHPLTLEAQRSALLLAPHPGFAGLLERVCAEESPTLVKLAVNVLTARRQGSFETIAPLLSHPNAGVRKAAAECLAFSSAREASLQLLSEHAKDERDDGALLASAESLLVLGSKRGLSILREKLEEEAAFEGSLPRAARAHALRLLGQVGGRNDGALLMRLLRADPGAALAVGFHGDAAAVPALIGALAESTGIPAKHAFVRALASALHRITGLGKPSAPSVPTPLVAIEVPLEAAFWHGQWEAHAERFAKPEKYRFGQPFSPHLVISEAETKEVLTSVQRDLFAEISILSRGASRAEPESWVAERLRALAEVGEHFRRVPTKYPDGQWPASALFE